MLLCDLKKVFKKRLYMWILNDQLNSSILCILSFLRINDRSMRGVEKLVESVEKKKL